jgi:hypothetical protein
VSELNEKLEDILDKNLEFKPIKMLLKNKNSQSVKYIKKGVRFSLNNEKKEEI